MKSILISIVILLMLVARIAYCSGDINEILEGKYLAKLDDWASRGGPVNEVQKQVVETCGKLVILTAVPSELTCPQT